MAQYKFWDVLNQVRENPNWGEKKSKVFERFCRMKKWILHDGHRKVINDPYNHLRKFKKLYDKHSTRPQDKELAIRIKTSRKTIQ